MRLKMSVVDVDEKLYTPKAKIWRQDLEAR